MHGNQPQAKPRNAAFNRLTAGLFAIPFIGWLFRADAEASLYSMLHPAMAAAIVLSSLVVIGKMIRSHRG
jgi:hypothetical protein